MVDVEEEDDKVGMEEEEEEGLGKPQTRQKRAAARLSNVHLVHAH